MWEWLDNSVPPGLAATPQRLGLSYLGLMGLHLEVDSRTGLLFRGFFMIIVDEAGRQA